MTNENILIFTTNQPPQPRRWKKIFYHLLIFSYYFWYIVIMCLLFIFVYQAVSQASRVKKEMSEMSGLKPVLCALHKVYTVVFFLPRLAE